ncbi:MAG: ArnT family glycosyltransferase [Candidatus Aminicenantes bacterium]
MPDHNFHTPSIKIEWRSRHAYLILLFSLAAVFLFSNLWIGDLGLDSCAYATISRSILRTNDWIVPHYQHCQEFSDCWLHPPLFYWMTALSFKIFGVNEFAARFISALLGVGTVLLVYMMGLRVSRSYRIGFLSGFVLLFTQPFLDLSRKCQLDVPLAFFITLSMFTFVLAIQKNEKYYILTGLFTGLAVLTKGLPAFSILGIIFLYFLLKGDFKFFIRPPFYILLLLVILTLCIWIIPLISVGKFKNFISGYFVGQIWTNLSGTESAGKVNFWATIQDYFWYITILAKRYWPWFPFLLLSIYFGFKRLRVKKILLVFMLWIFILIFSFSLGETKFYRYLAPVYPASAVLIGVVLGEKISEKVFKAVLNFSLIFLLTVLVATSIFPLYFGRINAPDKTEIKKFSPYIKQITKKDQFISVYRMNYWGAVADFAFYVDRPVKDYHTEESFSLSMHRDTSFGYIKKQDYEALSKEFKKSYLPVAATENFLLITPVQNIKSLQQRMFPVFIY